MKTFSGFEYLLIDAASNYGLDKENFEARLAWAQANLPRLEKLAQEKGKWKERPLYTKAVQAIRKAQKGKPTGHLVSMDAVSSGMQLMSAVTGCMQGALATGLIDPNNRADAYSHIAKVMSNLLGRTVEVTRKQVKAAAMPALYGSKKEPQKIFGKDTKELATFYEAMEIVAPGACDLLTALLDSWQPYALEHVWELPDGFLVRAKTKEVVKRKIEVDELDHSTFTYAYTENIGLEYDRKNAANVVHSLDGYVLRSLIRRCSYDREIMEWVTREIEVVLLERSLELPNGYTDDPLHEDFLAAQQRYEATQMPDIRILDYAQHAEIREMSSDHLRALNRIVLSMLEHKPFPVITVHDDFRVHPNNVDHLRKHYRNILAELSESTVLEHILSAIYGQKITYPKRSHTLGNKIRKSNYAIC